MEPRDETFRQNIFKNWVLVCDNIKVHIIKKIILILAY